MDLPVLDVSCAQDGRFPSNPVCYTDTHTHTLSPSLPAKRRWPGWRRSVGEAWPHTPGSRAGQGGRRGLRRLLGLYQAIIVEGACLSDEIILQLRAEATATAEPGRFPGLGVRAAIPGSYGKDAEASSSPCQRAARDAGTPSKLCDLPGATAWSPRHISSGGEGPP